MIFMNNFNYDYLEGNTYLMNNDRLFICDKTELNDVFLSKIKFPVMIFDTEFINQSHNKTRRSPLFIDTRKMFKNTRDIVYLVQYAIINSEEELLQGKYKEKIKSIVLERDYQMFNFNSKFEDLKKTFINVCDENNVTTFICSGGDT